MLEARKGITGAPLGLVNCPLSLVSPERSCFFMSLTGDKSSKEDEVCFKFGAV